MKISFLNIDWAKKYKNKTYINSIIETLSQTTSDIIIVTEALQSLQLPGYENVYQKKAIPDNIIYEGLTYTKCLKGGLATRVAIYSKYKATASYDVRNEYTSICKTVDTAKGPLTIYATTEGAYFTK